MVLVDVEKELLDNISGTRENINFFAFRDSLYLSYFVDSAKFEAMDNYELMVGVSIQNPIKDIYFQKITQINNISIAQDSILDKLTGLYSGAFFIDFVNEMSQNEMISNLDAFSKKDWYESLRFGQFNNQKVIDYFQSDPEYRSMVLTGFLINGGLHYQHSNYEYHAVPVYKKVRNYLDSLKIKRSDSLVLEYNPNDYKHLIGKYDFKWKSSTEENIRDSVIISIEKGHLNYSDYVTGEIHLESKIIPINKYRFRFENQEGVCHLEFNDQGDVESLRYSWSPNAIYWWKKVR